MSSITHNTTVKAFSSSHHIDRQAPAPTDEEEDRELAAAFGLNMTQPRSLTSFQTPKMMAL